jgi:hypothetical protein
MLDKVEPPAISDGYGLSLAFYCLLEVVKSVRILVKGEPENDNQSATSTIRKDISGNNRYKVVVPSENKDIQRLH